MAKVTKDNNRKYITRDPWSCGLNHDASGTYFRIQSWFNPRLWKHFRITYGIDVHPASEKKWVTLDIY